MNWNRPQFRLQGRQIVDARSDFSNELLRQDRLHQESWRQKKKQRQQQKRQQRHQQHLKAKKSFDLRAWIERDVREIANHQFFNTPEAVHAEVERRLAGIAHTRRVVAEMKARQRKAGQIQ